MISENGGICFGHISGSHPTVIGGSCSTEISSFVLLVLNSVILYYLPETSGFRTSTAELCGSRTGMSTFSFYRNQ